MKRTVVALAIVLTATEVFPAANRRRAVHPIAAPAQSQPWSIEITTEGGIAGSGNGGVTVASDGTVGILLMRDLSPRCTFKLDLSTLESLDRLVTLATPQSWVASYVPAAVSARCCDMIFTNMKLTRREAASDPVYTTQWLDAGPAIPPDLVQIINAVTNDATSIRGRFSPLCTTAP